MPRRRPAEEGFAQPREIKKFLEQAGKILFDEP
jgi:hypothetical protein